MIEVPLEAWSVDGISALASSLGNPLVMDNMTVDMCHNGLGRLDFARVLVEMDAYIEFKKTIEVQYRDNSNKVKGTKMVNVTYDWKPAVCTHCKVFGHNFNGCLKSPRTIEEDELAKIKEEEQMIKMDKNGGDEQTGWRSYGTQQNIYKEKANRRKENERDGHEKTHVENIEDDVLDDDIALNVNVIADEIKGSARQSILFHVESNQGNVNLFCTFVYASNNATERRLLWKDLYLHKRICEVNPWVIMGDMNVTLNLEEHSNGGSVITEEMHEFRDCINLIEMDDIGSYGFFYTWTKSLRNLDNTVLKKLDRVMVSENF
ncbi:RNA-directed DNA polymerase, eukaryota, reverse transcriptase zinc-binding domain protein [Tanacetum coccineum]